MNNDGFKDLPEADCDTGKNPQVPLSTDWNMEWA